MMKIVHLLILFSWREQAHFHQHEVVALLTDPEVTPRQRMIYFIAFYAGLRAGEMIGLRWQSVFSAEPLNKLIVANSYNSVTKTGMTRVIPIHTVLQTS